MRYLLLPLLLSACASVPEAPPVTMPVCNPDNCKVKWEAAQLFVVRNADMKIQIATDVLIETYSPIRTTDIALRVTKTPIGEGLYRISLFVWCSNPFGCNADPGTLKAQFASEIGQVQP